MFLRQVLYENNEYSASFSKQQAVAHIMQKTISI